MYYRASPWKQSSIEQHWSSNLAVLMSPGWESTKQYSKFCVYKTSCIYKTALTNGVRKGKVQGIIYIDEGQVLSPTYLFSKCSSVKGLQKHLQIPLSQLFLLMFIALFLSRWTLKERWFKTPTMTNWYQIRTSRHSKLEKPQPYGCQSTRWGLSSGTFQWSMAVLACQPPLLCPQFSFTCYSWLPRKEFFHFCIFLVSYFEKW